MKDGKGRLIAKKGEAFTKEKINTINLDRLQEMDFGTPTLRRKSQRSSKARKTKSSP